MYDVSIDELESEDCLIRTFLALPDVPKHQDMSLVIDKTITVENQPIARVIHTNGCNTSTVSVKFHYSQDPLIQGKVFRLLNAIPGVQTYRENGKLMLNGRMWEFPTVTWVHIGV